MKARNKQIHKVKPQEQHPYRSGLTDIGSVVQKLPVSRDLENLAVEIKELAKVQTISVFEIGKRLSIARLEMHDKQEWRNFLDVVSFSNSLASRYVKAYDTFEESLGTLPASKIFELMYVEDPEDVVLHGLPVEEGRKPIEQATVREIRANRSSTSGVKVRAFRQKEVASTVVSARVPTETSERIRMMASAKGLSISEYLSNIIEDTISRDIVENDQNTDQLEGEEEQ
ncbi:MULTISPECIES: DUF3102 domain-containing protein [Exiguobacterium]|uniref:DUF3102 domain-containing protein n=1 Tax=Exiguobacterium TaxID=33986 RepID=UPI001AE80B90|nr:MULTISPECIES: DUF3102 domain-containing protein [Exiguobacterium]MCT4780822.1 DUF3102 domain-containing protein [Exiguobacterium soli]